MHPHVGSTSALPADVGLGFKPQHLQDWLSHGPDVAFVEIHAENYMGAGGRYHDDLRRLRERYALSVHGVGLSLGGPEPLSRSHLQALAQLLARHAPQSFSEHLAWSSHGGAYFNDLLPLPYTRDTLQRVCDHIDQVQEALGRRLLLENPSTYLFCHASEMSETAFLRQVSRRTGCGLLLDVNNVYVSCRNHDLDPLAYMRDFPLDAVGEIHLAGHFVDRDSQGRALLIDHHGDAVADAVWGLYRDSVTALQRPVPTLIERDNHIPALSVLVDEAHQARQIMRDALDLASERSGMAA